MGKMSQLIQDSAEKIKLEIRHGPIFSAQEASV